MSEVDPLIASAKTKYDESLAKSLETPTVSQGDAYLSGILRLLPIIAGYAIGKKKGAVAGMQGGNIGATSFMENSKKRADTASKKAAIEAEAYKDIYDKGTQRKEKLEDSLDSKEFSLELNREKEAGRNARSSGLRAGLSELGNVISGLNPLKGTDTLPENAATGKLPETTNSTVAGTQDSSDVTAEHEAIARLKGVDASTPEGRETINAYINDQQAAGKLTGIAKLRSMGQDVAKGELDIAGKEQGLEKTALQMEKTKVDTTRSKQTVDELTAEGNFRVAPIDIQGSRWKPTEKVRTKTAATAQALGRQYNNAFAVIKRMQTTAANNPAFFEGLASNREAQEALLAPLYSALRYVYRTGVDNPGQSSGGANFEDKVNAQLPKLSGAPGAIIRSIFSAIGQARTPSQELAQLQDVLAEKMRVDLTDLHYLEDTSQQDLDLLTEYSKDPLVRQRALELLGGGK